MDPAICAAIGRRAVIEFVYDGGVRTVEPHAHGTSSAGHEVLRGYQVSGASLSGEPAGWKLYILTKISAMRETGQTFRAARPGYTPDGAGMASVHCCV